MLDSNNDGKVNRHEILSAPRADINADGKVTHKELVRVSERHLPPPPPPPRTSWPVARTWNSTEEAFDELVLVLLCLVTFVQAVRWLVRRVRHGKKRYKLARATEEISMQEAVDAEVSEARPGELESGRDES